jgi:Protein of unknown function (DUF3515)
VVVIVAFALSPSGRSDQPSVSSTAVVSVAAPTPSAAAIEPCAQVLSQLPVQLDGSDPRRVEPSPDSGAPVVAWGNPAIILQCGVARPKTLTEGSSALVIGVGAVNWLPVTGSKETVWFAIDRSVYIQVTVPKAYPQPPLASISTAIAAVLPAICHVPDEVASSTSGAGSPVGPLCVDRP